jgi:hypothetical protein
MSFPWAKFVDVLKMVGVPVLSMIPGVPMGAIPFVLDGIQAAEAIQGADGPTKKAKALAIVSDGLNALNTAKGEVVVDPVAVSGAVGNGIDAVITTVNAVKAAHAEDAAEAATPPPVPAVPPAVPPAA